jgi:hypothetical protein
LEWKGERRGKGKKVKKKGKTDKQTSKKTKQTNKKPCQRYKQGESELINSKLNRH